MTMFFLANPNILKSWAGRWVCTICHIDKVKGGFKSYKAAEEWAVSQEKAHTPDGVHIKFSKGKI